MAPDSINLANLLALYPELDRELDLAFKDAVCGVFRSSFQHSKEQVITAEVFFNKRPGLTKDDQSQLLDLIKGAGGFEELKARIKIWESPLTGGLSSFFVSNQWTSEIISEAYNKSMATKDFEFLVALPKKVLKEPLLEQLSWNVMTEAHAHFQDFRKQRLPKLYSSAQNIRQKAVYHQVEAEAKDQNQKRRVASRSKFFDEIEMAQTQANSGCVLYYL